MNFQIEVIKSKIHRVTVTQANLNYVGSITIDEALMEAANMIEGEKVQILDINNGERFENLHHPRRARQRLHLPERRCGAQGAGGRRGDHRLLCPSWTSSRPRRSVRGSSSRHGDQPHRRLTHCAGAGRPPRTHERSLRAGFFRVLPEAVS